MSSCPGIGASSTSGPVRRPDKYIARAIPPRSSPDAYEKLHARGTPEDDGRYPMRAKGLRDVCVVAAKSGRVRLATPAQRNKAEKFQAEVSMWCARRAEPSLVISMCYLSDQDHKVPIAPKGALYDFLSLSQEPEAQIVLNGRHDH
jgi:hypothetical protein